MTSKILQNSWNSTYLLMKPVFFTLVKTIKQIEILYNLEFKGVTDWLKANKLTLNVDKSNLVLFRSPMKKVMESIILKIDKKQIKEKEYTKYIGVLLDNQLSWGNQPHKPL